MAAIDEIKHVVVLILENHSFDQMLGCLNKVWPDLDGIDETRSNADDTGAQFRQTESRERQMPLDPHHEVEHVAMQLENGNGGFVRNFVYSHPGPPQPSATDRQWVMSYYPLDFLPALHPLGRNFTVCDRWFSSLPGPTWPNRFFALSGTALGRVDMPGDGTHKVDLPGFFAQTQDTIFDRLNDKGIHWKIYFHDIPQSWVMKHQRAPHNAARYFYIRQFFEDARGIVSDFPEFCLIEPDYMGHEENDDHPPHDIMKAEKLIADVYNALRGNEELWRSTLLVVFYDEHGGFYDHVVPPAAVSPDTRTAKVKYLDGVIREFNFNQFGVRVPAILASPWVKAGVEHTCFDHTSLLKFVTEKWNLTPLPSDRIKNAQSIGVALTEAAPRMEALPRILMQQDQLKPPNLDKEEAANALLSEHHKALKHLADFLPTALWEEAKKDADEAIATGWAATARAIDRIRSWCECGLAWLYETDDHQIVISSPDRIASERATPRNKVVRFLATQKPRALEGLAKRIRGEPSTAQAHAIRTLASITGRPFHRFDHRHARKWLDDQQVK